MITNIQVYLSQFKCSDFFILHFQEFVRNYSNLFKSNLLLRVRGFWIRQRTYKDVHYFAAWSVTTERLTAHLRSVVRRVIILYIKFLSLWTADKGTNHPLPTVLHTQGHLSDSLRRKYFTSKCRQLLLLDFPSSRFSTTWCLWCAHNIHASP